MKRDIPLWINEGLADYFRGTWDPLDLMMIRDAAVTEQVPRLSKAEFELLSSRLVYNMGHAAFEFMQARYGKEGIRQLLYTLRKWILSGTTKDIYKQAYKQAFRTTPEEFDRSFDKWLRERFRPFRDKERPSDRFKGESWRFGTSEPGLSFVNDPVSGEPVSGFRLVDGRASYGFGLQLFFLGYLEYLERAKERLKVVVPVTLLIVILLLYFNTHSLVETFIVLLAVPFSLIGAVWLLYFLDYNMSVAVWVGIIAPSSRAPPSASGRSS